MKVLVTGSKGFIGKNLVIELKRLNIEEIFEYDKESTNEDLFNFCDKADFIYHLAGVNRPKDNNEFTVGNVDLTERIIKNLTILNKKTPIMVSSSIQAIENNPYGLSKKIAEEKLLNYSENNESNLYVYRFTNVFGKWSQPNYNSVVATFCYNIANDKEIKVHDSNKVLNLIYIDDVVKELVNLLMIEQRGFRGYRDVNPVHSITLEELSNTIKSFERIRKNLILPNFSNSLEKKLYSTYLTFLPTNKFSYELKINKDDRGSFTEVLKSEAGGQVSINISKKGIVKGNHWHHTKTEKFLVVSGKAVIRFRNIFSNEVIEYRVSEDILEIVDIPPGYTHNIENIGDKDLVTLMWANEAYDPNKPDTIFLNI